MAGEFRHPYSCQVTNAWANFELQRSLKDPGDFQTHRVVVTQTITSPRTNPLQEQNTDIWVVNCPLSQPVEFNWFQHDGPTVPQTTMLCLTFRTSPSTMQRVGYETFLDLAVAHRKFPRSG